MKLIYHINSLYNPGGMERVTLNKVQWWVKKGVEVVVVTTDQSGRPTFYPFPEEVKIVDLGINYTDDRELGIVRHILSYLRKRRLHKKRLSSVLFEEKADIVISLYPGESGFIPSIKDGSKKVLELHQSKFFHRQYANSGLKGLIDRLREVADEFMVRKFDKFIVLSDEDRGFWGELPNIETIQNASTMSAEVFADGSAHRVIAVGRMDYQKSYDRLIEAWARIADLGDWKLDIFGQGEWEEMLGKMIKNKGLEDSVRLCKPTKNIASEYANSSIHVMSSHYEGFPMVMVEAMSLGLAEVAFDFKCGPRDIIENGVNGLIVPDGDIDGLAAALSELINNGEKRKAMGFEARKVAKKYSQEKIMEKWENCFRSILS